MKIFTSEQIKDWDNYTIDHKPISSIELMEHASLMAANWICNSLANMKDVIIFCGPGNNGGDGLAIARILARENYSIQCYVVKSQQYSSDFQVNLNRLPENIKPVFVEDISVIKINSGSLLIDAILGHGLNRPLSGIYAELANLISNSPNKVVAIDMPTGVFSDKSRLDSVALKADYTLTFQTPKLAQLMPENGNYIGELIILDIGLSDEYCRDTPTQHHFIDDVIIKPLIKRRNKFGHKGSFGKALIIAGSKGSMGATVLCSKACYRSGAGLVYSLIPSSGVDIMQISLPEAIVIEYKNEEFDKLDLNAFSSLGIGPGVSENENTIEIINNVFKHSPIRLVIDASALNLLAKNQNLFDKLPKACILTPHPKEFERLAGTFSNDFDRLEKLKQLAKSTHCIWILKGAHTAIALPEGEVYFNSTGNPGMATGGSGDVLTGIITGLLAQGYKPREAALLGVYMHGYAGDKASKRTGLASLLASDIIEGIKDFYLEYES